MSKSPKVQGFQGPGVPRSQGPKDQYISNSNSNTSLTIKKVHLVFSVIILITYLRWQWWWRRWNPWSIWQRWWWWWRGWWWWSAKSINNKGKEQQWKWTMGNFGVWIFLWFNTVRLENSLGNKQESIPRTHLLIFKLVINFSIFEIYFFIK